MPKLYYQGHGSFRITADNGNVIYVDPYAGEGYNLPADLILVTHQHYDHKEVSLVTQKPQCRVITETNALEGGKHRSFDLGWVQVEAVEACNVKHDPSCCVGYIITLDGVGIYASGDTSRTGQMEQFASRKLDYAILCGDGIYNMDLDEASDCAALIGARHSIPIHLKPGELFDRQRAEQFQAQGRIIVEPGEEIALTKA